MDTVIEPHPTSDPELRLLTDWSAPGAPVRWREAATVSAVAHVALVILLASLPVGFLVAAMLCMGAFQVVNYQKIGRFAWPFYIFSLLLIGWGALSFGEGVRLRRRPRHSAGWSWRSTLRPPRRTAAIHARR